MTHSVGFNFLHIQTYSFGIAKSFPIVRFFSFSLRSSRARDLYIGYVEKSTLPLYLM